MTDFAPTCPSCDPVAILREGESVWIWLHSAACTIAPEMSVAIPHGACPLHPSEFDVMTCRGCLQNFEFEREMRGAEF